MEYYPKGIYYSFNASDHQSSGLSGCVTILLRPIGVAWDVVMCIGEGETLGGVGGVHWRSPRHEARLMTRTERAVPWRWSETPYTVPAGRFKYLVTPRLRQVGPL